MFQNIVPLVLGISVASSLAVAQTGGRPIPGSGTINTPGSYVLQQDIVSGPNRAGIVVTANDVSIDLNGMTLTGPGGLQGVGVEIRNANGVRVSNGFVVNNAFGVIVVNSNNVLLSGLQIRGQGLPVPAPPPEVGIMVMQSKNVVVDSNSLYNIGLGIFVRGGMSGGNRISNNTITAGTNGLLGICYNPAASGTAGPVGDLIYRNLIHGFERGVSASEGSRYNVFQENTIFYTNQPVDFENQTNQDVDNRKIQVSN